MLLLLSILAGALAAFHLLTTLAGSRAVGLEKIVREHEQRVEKILDFD